MMSKVNYGREGKKIVFYDTDKRHVELKIRLKHDRLTQAEFFRTLVTGYLDKDEDILSYLDKYIKESGRLRKKNLVTSRTLVNDGKDTEKAFALGNDEIENIFDLLEEEHPEL
tara:strand:- start:172 stop:510 length:339 start_codon:yes stop_codon:yes gene_type:complete